MIEKTLERRIAYIHAAYGFVSGIFAGLYFTGEVMPFLSVVIWGVILSYPMMLITKSMYKLPDEDYNIKSWLGKGFLYFFTMWIVVWAFVYNVR